MTQSAKSIKSTNLTDPAKSTGPTKPTDSTNPKTITPAEPQPYFQILEPNFPDWLQEYIATPEFQKQKYISTTCGTIYTNLFDSHIFYSSYDHSIAVALIVWHFTHDKAQTLAGLFHDIATPTFKHCVDFLNGDYMTQESTEDQTSAIIKNSNYIANLLKRDHIKAEDIVDYHIYPIADNDIPKLSADRLEYSLANAYFIYELLTLPEVKEIYNDITVQQDESGTPELGFKTKSIARKFVKITSQMSIIYRDDRTRFSMQFIADLLQKLQTDGLLTVQDLYDLKESEVINLIESSKYRDAFHSWQTATKIHTSKTQPNGVYYVHHGAKVRYIDPLLNGAHISKQCKIAQNYITKNLSYDMGNYVYPDFDF